MLRWKILLIGLLSSFFFSFTFILNRSMSLIGGSFLWSSSLRYLFSLPFLFVIVFAKKRTSFIHTIIKQNLSQWILWSSVGFGLFYLPLTFASDYGSSWLVAATWQFSIVAGVLMNPLFGNKIPKKNLIAVIFILIGVFLLQIDNLSNFRLSDTFLCLLPVIIAAISYILGNRKMMSVCPDSLNTIERIYGMTLCSLPFWIISSTLALFINGLPSYGQVAQSFLVCIFSALIATILFFYATDLAKNSPKLLAIAESTIAGEVLFTILGGTVILKDPLPNIYGWMGLIVIIIGMIINAKISSK